MKITPPNNIFQWIHQNLRTYFRKYKTQYEYLIAVYGWGQKQAAVLFSTPKSQSANASKWMREGKLPDCFFQSENQKQTILDSPDTFANCYSYLRDNLQITNTPELQEIICNIIFDSKSENLWKTEKQQFIQIFQKYDTVHVLAFLLIYAQIKKIPSVSGYYQMSSDFTYIKSYKKSVIESNFETLVQDASEINMSQISCPSLISSAPYTEFFKKGNLLAIENALTTNPDLKLNMLFMSPDLLYADQLIKFYMYGNSFFHNTKVIEDSIRFAFELSTKFPKQVTAKVTNTPMSYSLFHVKKKTLPSIIKIDVYVPITCAEDRFSFILDSLENKDIYNYYLVNFTRLFDSAISIEKFIVLLNKNIDS